MLDVRSALRWTARIAAGLAVLWALVFAFPACNTPFIPIPPPADPTFAPIVTTDGMGGSKTVWEARGGPQPAMAGAKVYLYNYQAGSGVIVRAQPDGAYAAGPFEGRLGDRVQLWYENAKGEESPELCRLLEQGVARTDCPRGAVDAR